jgi:hypothetical protein
MFAAILLDPRLGFLLLSVLVIGAAIPLAIAWARLLPEEKPPFSFPDPSETDPSADANSSARPKAARDPFAITLLIFVTLSFLWQVPGVPRNFLLSAGASFVPESWFQDVLLFCREFFMAIPAIAAAYSVFQPHKIRIPLILGGILVPLLWFTAPWLRAAFLSP